MQRACNQSGGRNACACQLVPTRHLTPRLALAPRCPPQQPEQEDNPQARRGTFAVLSLHGAAPRARPLVSPRLPSTLAHPLHSAPCPARQFSAEDEHWGAPPLRCRALNHVALGADDVHALERFYTKARRGEVQKGWQSGTCSG